MPWIYRLINSFGSPNTCNGTEICSWHREFAGSFTTGAGIGTPDYERAGCILLWGFNPSTSWLAAAGAIADARARGAKLVVVDPRRIGLAVKADHWLPVRPGTDGAVALSIAGVMIEHGWFDGDFMRDWTNGPFLVRDDDGTLLRCDSGEGFVAWDEGAAHTSATTPGLGPMPSRPSGSPCAAPTPFRRVTVRSPVGPPSSTSPLCAALTRRTGRGNRRHRCRCDRQVAHLIWHHRPLAYFTWTGLEQHTNATHTARAHATLYALTGCFDVRAAICSSLRCR